MTPASDERRAGSSGWEAALQIALRRKWTAVVAFAAAFAAGATIALSLPNLYRATTTVLVEPQQISETFVRPSVTSELQTRLETIRQEVMSRARLGALIARFDLYPALRAKGAPLDAAVDRMRHDIDLELQSVDPQSAGRGPTIAFAIAFSGRDPDLAAGVANALATIYVQENSRMRAGQASRTADFLKAQVIDARKDLEAQERSLGAFKLSHLGELPQQVEANLASLDRLNTQLRLNGESQIRVLDRRERLEQQLAAAESAPRAAVPATPASPRAERIAKLRSQLEDLRRTFTDEYPDVIRVRGELQALERQHERDPLPSRDVAAPSQDAAERLRQEIASVDAEVDSLKNEEAALRRAVTSYEQRVDNVPRRQEEFDTLSRDYATTKERYESLVKRYEDAQLADSLEQGRNVEQFRILDPAVPPREPAAPNRVRLLVMALAGAIAIAAAAVLLAEHADPSFHSLDDLRGQVSGQVIFSIPAILTRSDRRRARRRFALGAVSVALALAIIVAGAHRVAVNNEQIVRLTGRGHV